MSFAVRRSGHTSASAGLASAFHYACVKQEEEGLIRGFKLKLFKFDFTLDADAALHEVYYVTNAARSHGGRE